MWQPQAGLSCSSCPNPIASPSITTVYTLLAVPPISSPPSPNIVVTTTVVVTHTCCSSSYSSTPLFTSTPIAPGGVYNGPLLFQNSFTIQPNQILTFGGGEYIFSPNVKITVSAGAQLQIKDAHLYSCNSMLWKGIEVLDGGSLSSTKENVDNLIEDALVAIDVSNHTTSNVTPIF